MKKLISLSFILLFSGAIFGQKYAYIDTDYILSNIPAYDAAKEQLDDVSAQWQREIEGMYAEVEKLYKDYQAESVLLSDEMKRKKEDNIIDKERAAKELQKKYFGQNGALFKKRQELIKPIQDDIYNAVKELASEGSYALIFDISGSGLSILYTDPRYDISDEVLKKLGYKD